MILSNDSNCDKDDVMMITIVIMICCNIRIIEKHKHTIMIIMITIMVIMIAITIKKMMIGTTNNNSINIYKNNGDD